MGVGNLNEAHRGQGAAYCLKMTRERELRVERVVVE
jgi:hypothetical protein